MTIERLVLRLGHTAVPLLGRELRSLEPACRDAARDALAIAATTARARVIAELRAIAAGGDADEPKVSALGLLAELGERGNARFLDPTAIQRRSAAALAQQLESPADIASAADLIVHQLKQVDATADILQLLAAMRDVAPAGAASLVAELAVRLDLGAELRARVIESLGDPASASARAQSADATHDRPRRLPRPTRVSVLVDAAARLVVVASRKVSGERRWRRWAVLIGQAGRIDDCLYHDELADSDDSSPLIAHLCADGYHVASTEFERAHTIVAVAARLTGAALGSPYYLGRDLLDLTDAHVATPAAPISKRSQLGRAVELIAAGDFTQADALLAGCDQANPDVAAAQGASRLAQGDHAGAVEPLQRALAVDPDWPLHHWNLGVALHKLGDTHGTYHALRRFVTTSAARSGLYADLDQPGRVACAERLLAELERLARLTGTSLRRRRRTTKPRRVREIQQ